MLCTIKITNIINSFTYNYYLFLQVKVWFQNRRTKHKRTKDGSEDGMDGQTHDDSDIDDDLEICDEDDEPTSPKRQCLPSF